MRVTLEPTAEIVHLKLHGLSARIWSGHTESGVPLHFLVARIAVPQGLPEQAYIEIEEVLIELEPRDPVGAAMDEALAD